MVDGFDKLAPKQLNFGTPYYLYKKQGLYATYNKSNLSSFALKTNKDNFGRASTYTTKVTFFIKFGSKHMNQSWTSMNLSFGGV